MQNNFILGATDMQRNFTLRIDESLLDKFHYVSRYSGRSANSQLVMMIRKIVEQFEQTNGEIETEEE